MSGDGHGGRSPKTILVIIVNVIYKDELIGNDNEDDGQTGMPGDRQSDHGGAWGQLRGHSQPDASICPEYTGFIATI